MKKSKIEVKYGIVAVLDALGISTYDIEQAKDFIRNRDELLDDMLQPVKKEIQNLVPEIDPPITYTFGDTIIFSWNTGEDNILKLLTPAAEWLRTAIKFGIAKGILLRGSLAVGEYIVDSNTIIGPSIADATAWYGEANWFGVIATPLCGLSIISLIESFSSVETPKEFSFSKRFVEYEVPLRNGGSRRLWVISWPFDIWSSADDKMTALCVLSTVLTNFQIPKGTEDKYTNALDFFKWYGKKILEKDVS